MVLVNDMPNNIQMIGTDTAYISRWWVKRALELIEIDKDAFSDLRQARVKFIAGSNRIRKTIKNWMIASGLAKKSGRSIFLTDAAKRLKENDPDLKMSSTWLVIHLAISFSDRGEPYISFFRKLDPSSHDWVDWKTLTSKVYTDTLSTRYEFSSVKNDLEAVRGMFRQSGPLRDLGLVDNRSDSETTWIRLGDAGIPDEAIIHALALARHRHFPSRTTIHFSELIETGFNHFLCLSVNALRQRLRQINRAHTFHKYFRFVEGKDLDSVQFGDHLHPNRTILLVLHETEDTWL